MVPRWAQQVEGGWAGVKYRQSSIQHNVQWWWSIPYGRYVNMVSIASSIETELQWPSSRVTRTRASSPLRRGEFLTQITSFE